MGFWKRYKKGKPAIFGLIVVLSLMLVAVIAPFVSPYDPEYIGEDLLEAPCTQYFMGTDDLGRDIFSQVLYGTRISLCIGLLAAATSTIVGIFVGSISGYFGGAIDDLLMRLTEIFMSIPRFFLLLLIVTLFGSSVWNITGVIGILSWPSIARVTRSEFLTLREREFVEAARSVGANNTNIIFSEILPNASPPIIVNSSLLIARAILTEAGLSFLGLGDPTVISLGRILMNAQHLLSFGAWWTATFPGLIICFAVIGFNLIGDGLDEALNPKLKEV